MFEKCFSQSSEEKDAFTIETGMCFFFLSFLKGSLTIIPTHQLSRP